MALQLYTYFRSSAAFRTRIALNLKGVAAEHVFVDFSKGAQFKEPYRSLNPQARVPALAVDGQVITQSMAIMEYLEESHPTPPLLPKDTLGRARVRALANIIACDIHPLNNLAVLKFLERDLGVAKDKVDVDWYQNWVRLGFEAFEAMLAGKAETGTFCHGDSPTLADVCLVPQVFNAQRYKCDLAPFPTLMRIHEACMALPAFDAAQPSKQPEAAQFQ